MVHQCASWETCMNRDPTVVGRAKVGAEMIAEVVNSFVEPISWKTLVR
jgi:Di-sulfide bridge nucleocytoplasmic transport domain